MAFALLPTAPQHPNNQGVRVAGSYQRVALAAADSSANTTALDLGGSTSFGQAYDNLQLRVAIDALPNLTNSSYSVTVTVQDSADNSSFATVAGLGNLTVAGVSTTGATASSIQIPIPSHTRRYVRINVASPASGGDHTAAYASVETLLK